MYRIELGPDDVGVFRSIEEMATAIKTGVITPKARIYHSASDKWLPIEFHPHFKRAREMAAGGVPPAPPASHHVPVRTEPEPPSRRTPIPAPSPVAGLPLIDVSTPAAPPPPPVVPAPVILADAMPVPVVPEPVVPEPVVPELVAPEPVAPEPVVPELVAPEPVVPTPVVPTPVAASVLLPEPEPVPAEPAEPEPEEFPALPLPLPVAVTYLPPPAPPQLVIPPLPEPEREAIFLSAAAETASWLPAAEPAQTVIASAEPTWSDLEHAVANESEPMESAPEQPRIAAALPAFQLPRVDLRLGQRRRPMLIAAAAVVLAASTHLALSSTKPQWELGIGVPLPDLGPNTLRAERPQPSPTNATVLPASVPAAKGSPSFGGASAFATPGSEPATPVTPMPVVDTVKPPAPAAIAPPPKVAIAAPKVAVPPIEGDLKSAAGLIARYDAAHSAAEAELENGLKTAGFTNLFATTRLQPAGLRAARASVGTASAYIQRYRRREADIEQAYRDSFDLLASRNKWSDGQRKTWEGRKVRREHPEIAKLSSFLLQSLDSLYGLLSGQEGAYQLAGGTITFDEAAASRAYGELRPWLDRRAHAWADVESETPTTAARILQAMGTAKLPEGGSL